MEDLFQCNTFQIDKSDDFPFLLLKKNKQQVDTVIADLIDKDIFDEIKTISTSGNAKIYFGKTLRDIKVLIHDEERLRGHEIFLEYKAPRKLLVTKVNLPFSAEQNREFSTLEEVVESFKLIINNLARYFYELEQMDQFCTIMEPVHASFKDDYRRILLDDRTWLHVALTPKGLAANIHLVGQSVHWHDKLQTGLLKWDHDKNVVENIMTIFDLSTFPQLTTSCLPNVEQEDKVEDAAVCGICLCVELPEAPGVPQPLCQNTTCGVYYHRNCLYQWLVACAGSRAPAFGVANGSCPTCLQPITCSEKDG